MIKLRKLITENKIFKIGLDPKEHSSDMPVNWNKQDVQILDVWNINSIRKFVGLDKKYTAIYPAIIDVNDLDPHLAEEDPDLSDEEELGGGGYDWDEFRMRRSGFPPILVRRNISGKINILDGNHRVKWARDVGYKTISAWVVDDIIQREVSPKK